MAAHLLDMPRHKRKSQGLHKVFNGGCADDAVLLSMPLLPVGCLLSDYMVLVGVSRGIKIDWVAEMEDASESK